MQLKPNTSLQGGKYRIIRTLGQGGFGITYEAEQVLLRRTVALKEFFMKEYCNRDSDTSHVSVPSVGSVEMVEQFKDKFLKEARSIASMDDPHIVRIHDVFEENDTAYYVMEYLPGGSLADKCRDEAMPEKDAVRYITQIASALSYLHSLPTPLNHLDIKPSNVLLNTKGQAVLIDFGISKRYDYTGQQTSSTPVGVSHGYSPSEQYREGGIREFSPATDVYSLGATLYKMVTGETPPHASDILMDGLPDLPMHLSASTRDAIGAAMKPRRKDRPQSIAAFMSILKADNEVQEANEKKTVQTPQVKEVESEETVIIGKSKEQGVGVADLHEYVDLGLPSGLKWATCNVGASSPEEYGYYFAWGETKPKHEFTWENYRFRVTGHLFGPMRFSKYNTISKKGSSADNKIRLDSSDDAASVNWGGRWRMPTFDEIKELRNHCTWTWTFQNGKYGYKVTSNTNDKSIFLPAAGYRLGAGLNHAGSRGSYWSSSLIAESPSSAWCVHFGASGILRNGDDRGYGFSVRAVTE